MALPININPYPVTISPGQSLSAAVGMGADTLVGISMPAAWVAAALTFQVSIDGETWQELYADTGTEVTIPSTAAAAGQFIVLPTFPSYIWRGVNLLKVRSGTAGAPVVQTAGATITLIGRPEIM